MKKVNLHLYGTSMYLVVNQELQSGIDRIIDLVDGILPKYYKNKFKRINNTYELVESKNQYIKFYSNGLIKHEGYDKLISLLIVNNIVQFIKPH